MGTVGATTAVALTGVVATVTSETTARLTAPGAEADLPGVVAVTGVPEPPLEPPPELPEEFAVHCATHVIAAAVIVTVAPAEIVEPLLQLQPANVKPERLKPDPLPAVLLLMVLMAFLLQV